MGGAHEPVMESPFMQGSWTGFAGQNPQKSAGFQTDSGPKYF
jgi:hypothetical protein